MLIQLIPSPPCWVPGPANVMTYVQMRRARRDRPDGRPARGAGR